jgi:hypothetical protein
MTGVSYEITAATIRAMNDNIYEQEKVEKNGHNLQEATCSNIFAHIEY